MGAAAVSPAGGRPQLLAASYRASARVLRGVPAGGRRAAASAGGTAWFLLNVRQRRAALDNYAAVLGVDRSDPRAARVARRAFQNYGRMLIDFLVLGDLSRDEVIERMSVDGREHLDAALAGGRGVIMAAPHMGSWDMSGAYAAATGYRIWTVADRLPGSLNRAASPTRNGFELNSIQ